MKKATLIYPPSVDKPRDLNDLHGKKEEGVRVADLPDFGFDRRFVAIPTVNTAAPLSRQTRYSICSDWYRSQPEWAVSRRGREYSEGWRPIEPGAAFFAEGA
ncbi:MAG TPA: hypothetical protein VIU41_15840, partial [Geobacteraceae bacterium]